ncbi:hypothetical protein CAPTEDRAFT_155984 [Capitella teleta]|uniref:Uncharacterized protein n=1 Tax=Capitella teleta TaxID=283909 RepID=R7VJN7_CAPTE|nr:hypothetical protein CAPTEDRAFT_155984 [Capitella teleta]|eukprot:ELU16065.1 hypothetical protein CAPTEDRAFT_155984 [Capitella teleta]
MAAWGIPPEQSDQTKEADWPVEHGKSSGSGWGDATEGAWGSQWSEQQAENAAEEEAMEGEPAMASAASQPTCYAAQVTPEQFQQEARDFTRQEVNRLMSSPEYQTKITRCHLCWSVWFKRECSSSCLECGGFAMQRPCPICNGRCGAVWKRDVEMSHSHSKAHWDGECRLPPDQMRAFLAQHLVDYEGGEESLLDAMTDLHAS